MKIFISWSGERSKRVAELLKWWLKCVIQASDPWVSSEDISRGAVWFSSINDQLAHVTSGIVCLTSENKEKPWILFEAGAMAKGISTNKVYTFLIDVKPAEIQNPLAQFNHTQPTKEDVKKLINSINIDLGERSLDKETIDSVFEIYWTQFKSKFDIIVQETEKNELKKELSDREILMKLLNESEKVQLELRSNYYRIEAIFQRTQTMMLEQSYKQQFFIEKGFWDRFRESLIKSFKEDEDLILENKTKNLILDLHTKGYSIDEIYNALKTEGVSKIDIKKVIEDFNVK